jgi:hypothetical protein
MTLLQKQAIKCAYADLKGALECYERGIYHEHDWEAHKLSIEELEDEFKFLTDENITNENK